MCLKVIDQGADDTTNAVVDPQLLRRKVADVETTTEHARGDHHPDAPPHPGNAAERRARSLVYQVPMPEPLRFLEPRETETRTMHALEEYGLHARQALRGHRAPRPHRHHLRLSGDGRGALPDGPLADRRNSTIRRWATCRRRCSSSAPAARSASTPCRPTPRSSASTSRTTPSRIQSLDQPCALCGAEQSLSRRGHPRRPRRHACSSAPTPTIARRGRPRGMAGPVGERKEAAE